MDLSKDGLLNDEDDDDDDDDDNIVFLCFRPTYSVYER
jgi:hypothetical protein